MKPDPIDATKLALRALRALDDGQRAVQDGWKRLTEPAASTVPKPNADPRRPPEIW